MNGWINDKWIDRWMNGWINDVLTNITKQFRRRGMANIILIKTPAESKY